MAKKDFESALGVEVGWGRGADFDDEAWDPLQKSQIEAAVKSGLRQVYFPAIPGVGTYHWSYLTPTTQVTLLEGDDSVAFPDDFAYLKGELTLVDSERAAFSVPITGPGQIRDHYFNNPSMTGQPLLACVRPLRGTNATVGQQFDLFVYPFADQDYTVEFAYALAPDALTGDRPYAYRGPAHHETFLAACLAAFEKSVKGIQDGPAKAYFQERLMASIAIDRQNKPIVYGYNGDTSDERHARPSMRHGWNPQTTITYQGAEI